MNDTVQFNFVRMTDISTYSAEDDPRTEKLLDAAKAAFLTHGYAAASMDQVARLAQASKTTLYTRFPSKESLFIAVVRRECAQRGMGFAAHDFDHLPLAAALRDIADRFLDLLWSPEALRVHQVVTGEAARQPEIAQLFYDAAVAPACAAVIGYINRAMTRGLLPAGEAEFIALQFLASLQGGPHCALTLGLGEPPPPAQRGAYVARAVALFLRGAAAGELK